ncbi:MAG TPA: EamA family transporter, partial [Spirochaetia bacterium]|nr:EamA family transporter [Spirochaetia bacterium]
MVTALCWSFAALLFSRAGKRVGSLTVNFFRLLMGATLTPLCHLFLYGSLFPLQVTALKLLLFILSGFFTF